MKFNPQKCKVVPVAPPGKGLKDLFNKIFPLRKTFFYKLGDTKLEYVQEEKDLGIIVRCILKFKVGSSGGCSAKQSQTRLA